jgi:hypothetical protein
MRKNAKQSARFYSPFQIIKKICPVAYKLVLPQGSRIHLVFHISLLKRYLGSKHIACPHLPEVLEEGRMTPKPQVVLETRTKNKKNRVVDSLERSFSGGGNVGRLGYGPTQFPEFFLRDKEVVRGEG